MPKTKDAVQNFRDLLERKGLKYTYERECLYEEIQRTTQHFDADSLYDRFRKRGDTVGRATVYRNLPLFLEAGVIQKSAGEGKKDFYEKTDSHGHHDHMVCLSCKKIIEFHDDDLEILQAKIAQEYKFKIIFHDHRLFGYCQKCSSLSVEKK